VGFANAVAGFGDGGGGGGGVGFVSAAAGLLVDGESAWDGDVVDFDPVLVVGSVATGGFGGVGDDGPPLFCKAVLGVVVVGVSFVLAVPAAGVVVPVAVDPLAACGSVVPPVPGKAFCLGMVDP
jgi:hypothetical protein